VSQSPGRREQHDESAKLGSEAVALKPSVGEQVRTLTAQRVQIEQQRHEVDQRLAALEGEERESVEKGAAAKSDAERRQLAGKLVRTRRDLRRVRAQANVYSQQIDILGTHLHHLTLAEQGKRIELPRAEELTKEAAEAEQMMAELSANADLAAGLKLERSPPLMAEEEAAIMEEFKQAAAEQTASQAGAEGGGTGRACARGADADATQCAEE